ncbi:GSCFA domain-containing protein [Galbibacter pacificus]|uniref:GSCFA domain-containing protein n=1 Tax=Galbibacter pacificus TaxID=2996052 RepID=A0ABT6FVY6_9FLAO|nr:GSCFA domain-containing protein [Galbibacter pacificus]MDG3584138.1 GSCFA domain-containing protein [Galbibacter pacificus]MDG3587429.1 GSCFA domain-containing protein [Galbibacter pacificus]
MKLQTQIPLKVAENTIDYNSKVFLMGSCFVENIGEKLQYFKFQNLVNPFGIIFHPVAMEHLLDRVVKERFFTVDDIFYLNERWQCFEVHSEMGNSSKEAFLDHLNTSLEALKAFLQEASHVVITLGTAWGYRHMEQGKIVANCHKVPQKCFQKELMEVNALSLSLKRTTSLLLSLNPEIEIIFTVSPVRHIKDGFVENQLSKAHLIAAVHQIITGEKRLHCFPSYEIMMDELRDYRFYAEDMLHPNETAVKYIWKKFQDVWIDHESLPIMKEVEKVQNGLQHRPFNRESEEYKKFQLKLQQKIVYLSSTYPHIQF